MTKKLNQQKFARSFDNSSSSTIDAIRKRPIRHAPLLSPESFATLHNPGDLSSDRWSFLDDATTTTPAITINNRRLAPSCGIVTDSLFEVPFHPSLVTLTDDDDHTTVMGDKFFLPHWKITSEDALVDVFGESGWSKVIFSICSGQSIVE